MVLSSNETGRSMIEMLGVLAIIGVLSVGGIAGYSKAMMQYKINKTVDQVSQIVGNMRTLYGSQKNYANIDATILKKAHIIPDEMWGDGYSDLSNAFGGDVVIETSDKKNGSDNKAFTVELFDLPEEACMALATYDWGSGSSSGLIAISASNFSGLNGYWYSGCSGSINTGSQALIVACPNGDRVSVPMPVDKAAEGCECPNSECRFALKFY
ncbi:MAG: hypothetical protein J6N49_01990 [Alphaproteobacteria bacterium]|nr:hypothetical protein [Alphaproteobacteria bacterium]